MCSRIVQVHKSTMYGSVNLQSRSDQAVVSLLVEVDLASGAATPLAFLSPSPSPSIAISPSGKGYRMVGRLVTNRMLQQFDIETGGVVEEVNVTFVYPALEYVGCKLYGAGIQEANGMSVLNIINPKTGEETLVGTTGVNTFSGLAYDCKEEILYGVTSPFTSPETGSRLYTIDLATAAATLVGPTSVPLTGLEYAKGVLYAVNPLGALYTLNAMTGEAKLVGPSVSGLSGLSFD